MATMIISILLVVTWLQVRYWADSFTLFRHALDVTEKNDVAHNNLGARLYYAGKIDEAIPHFVEALRIMPYYKSASDNLQTALAEYGNNQNAIANMGKLLKVYPGDPTLHYILGNLYKNSGKLDKAVDHYKKSLAQQPPLSHAMHNLAMVYATKKEYKKALFLLNQMIELWPNSPGAYYYITAIYAKQNKKEESIRWLKKAVTKGFNNWELLEKDTKLENIRDRSYYQSLIRKH
jgi:tetratricopeptide (TPR) repeat protein